MGAILLILYYYDLLKEQPYFVDTLICFGQFMAYIIPFAICLVLLRFLISIPSELFRKMLHFPAMTSLAVVAHFAPNYQVVSLTLLLFAALFYPILRVLELWPGYNALLVQRRSGEIKRSLLLLYVSNAAFAAFCGGVLGHLEIAVIDVGLWGCQCRING